MSSTTIQVQKRRGGETGTLLVTATATVESEQGTEEKIQESLTQDNIAANIPSSEGLEILSVVTAVSPQGEICLFTNKASLLKVICFACFYCNP